MLKEKRYHVTKHKSISVVKHIAEIIVVLNFKLRKPLFSTNYQKKPNKTKKKQKTRGTIQVPCLTHIHLKMENQTSISNTDKTKIQY